MVAEVAQPEAELQEGNQHRPKYIVSYTGPADSLTAHCQLHVPNDGVRDQSIHGGGLICSIDH